MQLIFFLKYTGHNIILKCNKCVLCFWLGPDQRLVVGEERRGRHQPVQSQKHFHQLLHDALRPHATQVHVYLCIARVTVQTLGHKLDVGH